MLAKRLTMEAIQFIGRVLPEACKISIKGLPITWEDPNFGSATFNIQIKDSCVLVECKTTYLPSDLTSLYMRAFDLSRAAVDLVSFANGWGLSVILDAVIKPDGSRSTLFPQDPELSDLSSVLTINKEPNDYTVLYEIVLSDPSLFMALNDLISCLIFPHHSSINSARVIERIKNLIAPPNVNSKKAWSYLHDNLNVEANYLKPITDSTRGPRHGGAYLHTRYNYE